MLTLDLVIGLAVGLITTGLATILKSRNERKKQERDSDLSANDQALLVYKNIVDNLQKRLAQIEKDQEELREEYIKLRETNIELKLKSQMLEDKNKELKIEIEELKKKLKE